MELETINALACCLDDTYHTSTNSGTRKVTSRLEGNKLTLNFQTIANIARDCHLHVEAANLKREGAEIINDKLKTVKSAFKENTGKTLKIKKETERDGFETVSVSAYSPVRVVKYTFSVCYQID